MSKTKLHTERRIILKEGKQTGKFSVGSNNPAYARAIAAELEKNMHAEGYEVREPKPRADLSDADFAETIKRLKEGRLFDE